MKSILLKAFFTLMLAGSLASCGCITKCTEPAGAIDPAIAQGMQQEYMNNQHLYINTVLDSIHPGTGEDNLEVWFSIQEIEQYICYAKSESLKKGFSLSGLRVYLASKGFPDPTDPDDIVPRTTVFFVPTHKTYSPITRSVPENTGENNPDTPNIKPLNMGDTGNGTYENTGE